MSDAEKMRHTRSTLTTKAMTDKTLTFQTKAIITPLRMNFTLPMKSFMTPRPSNDEKENDEPAKDTDDTSIIYPIWEWRRSGLLGLSVIQCLSITQLEFCGMHAADLPSFIKNSDWINFNNRFCDMHAADSTIRLVTYA
jgi:hypothetical protein